METDNKSRSDNPNEKDEQNRSPKPAADSKTGGETMRDSMTESAPNNDNTKIPEAEKLTDEHGKLNAEAFKKSYQEDSSGKSEKKNESDS